MSNPKADFPAKLECLFQPARYKILYGGRGGAKSWGVARALLILCAERPLRVLCAREIQRSIRDSVHQLLRDQIAALGMESFFQVLDSEIRGKNGSLFTFAGLRHNIANVRSKEGVDIVWVEEANLVSKSSWDALIPTIRKEESEIWVTFNPELDTDETYKRFVLKPPTGATLVKMNWSDNPWFPDVLRQEKDDLKVRDPDSYLTVWEGHCRQTLDGAVYANEIRTATEAGRICRVPYDASKPVDTFWDLGRADSTAIWFGQAVGFEYRIIDYYESHGHALGHYLKELQVRAYVYGTDFLPHDAENELLASERTISQQMRVAGRRVQIAPKVSVADGINAARTIFGQCWFDEDKCADGLQALRHYRYEKDEDLDTYKRNPLHDWASHGADAFRYLALSLQPRRERKRAVEHVGGWMG